MHFMLWDKDPIERRNPIISFAQALDSVLLRKKLKSEWMNKLVTGCVD